MRTTGQGSESLCSHLQCAHLPLGQCAHCTCPHEQVCALLLESHTYHAGFVTVTVELATGGLHWDYFDQLVLPD